jgi:putative endonuclease
MREYCVYLMTNVIGMLYTGVTNNIARRVSEHKTKGIHGFTSRYNLIQLVYYESSPNIMDAIVREKQIKGWVRSKKVDLIESMNPEWRDLSQDILGDTVDEEKRDPSLRSG